MSISTLPASARPADHGDRLPRVYRDASFLEEAGTLFTLQALRKASDAHDVRVASTKLEDSDIEG